MTYPEDEQREGESITDFTIRRLRNTWLREAAEAARGGLPSNEPGDYAEGRHCAADAVLALIS